MDEEIKAFLLQHLQTIQKNEVDSYYETTSEDLTLYEWWVTPHRLDGLPFHEFMMNANAERGTVFGAESKGMRAASRFDLANLHILALQALEAHQYSGLLNCDRQIHLVR